LKRYQSGIGQLLVSLLLAMSLTACVSSSSQGPDRKSFDVKSLAKSDIDTVIEFHIENMRDMLARLMTKLYKRNPRELAKSEYDTIAANRERLFDRTEDFRFPELYDQHGSNAIHLAFNEDYEGDRVFAFVAGLTGMVMASYDYQRDFYLFDTVDPQKLYNSARNIEIAAWKITHDRREDGQLFLLTNSMTDEMQNLSYERLFGKLIATQDNIAEIMADRQNRIIKKVFQNMATAVFLPI